VCAASEQYNDALEGRAGVNLKSPYENESAAPLPMNAALGILAFVTIRRFGCSSMSPGHRIVSSGAGGFSASPVAS